MTCEKRSEVREKKRFKGICDDCEKPFRKTSDRGRFCKRCLKKLEHKGGKKKK